MKFLKNYVLAALVFVCHLPSSSQGSLPQQNEPDYNKPKIFSDLPEKFTLHLNAMEALLNLTTGARVNGQLANGFILTGIVVSKSDPADASLKTVVIKSHGRQGAILTFSRVMAVNGSLRYIGRMMNKDAGDALEIYQEGAEILIRKKGLYDMINE